MVKPILPGLDPRKPGVAVPPSGRGCWAEVRYYAGPAFPQFMNCGNLARGGQLTCFRHAHREDAAQALKAQKQARRSDA